MEQILNKIVVGYDFSSAARHALYGSLILAKETGAEVTVVTAVPAGIDDAEVERIMSLSDYTMTRLEATSEGLEDVEKYVKADVEKLDPGNVSVKFDVGQRRVDKMILDTTDLIEGDLIVVGGVGQEGDVIVPVGTDTMRLVRASRWPVMVVKRSSHFPPRKILTATDFSEASTRAIGWAFDLAKAWDAEVEVVHVLSDKDTETARKDATALIAGLKPELDYTLTILEGSAHRAIVDYARKNDFDLLSVGSLGRSRIIEVLIGGTTERILRQLPCSVLMVKPDEFAINYKNPVE